MIPKREIRATFNKTTITVYQAFSKEIALPALKNNQLVPPFSYKRMTWIKPSFLWLMQRSNWATKPNQEYILAIKIKRDCWEEALAQGVLTHPDAKIYSSGTAWHQLFKNAPVHIQWDPERTLYGTKKEESTIQVGISASLIKQYAEEWIVEINDFTPLAKKINTLRKQGKYKEAKRLLPIEKPYPLPDAIKTTLGIH